MTTQTVTTNFRVLFTIGDVLQEVKVANSMLKMQLCDTTKYVQLPCSKPVTLDFPGVQMGSKIEFDLEDAEGNVYGYSEFPLPDSAFKTRETQINQQVHFYLNNSDKEFIATRIFLILLNTEAVQRPKFKNSLPKTPSKSTNAPAKSPNKSSQKKKESSSHKRQRTEDKGSYPSVDNSATQQDTQGDFSESIRGNDTFDQGDYSRIQNAVYSQASLDNFLPNSLLQLSTPKDVPSSHENIFASKSDQVSLSNVSDKGASRKIQNLDQRLYSEAGPEMKKNEEHRGRLITLTPLDNNTNSSFRKEDQYFNQLDVETIDASNSYAIPTESDAIADQNLFQTFCPGPSNSRSVNKEQGNINENTPEKQQDRSIDDETRLHSSNKKRKPPTYSPISEKNATSRLSYSEIAFYKAQVEQLQNALLMRDSEMTIVNILKKENAELKAALQKSEEARKSIQLVSSETTIELKQVNQELQGQVANALQEKKDFLNKNVVLQNRVEELEKVVSKVGASLEVVENQNMRLNAEVKELRNVNENFEKTKQAAENFEHKRSEERLQYMNALAVCQKGLEEAMARVERLTKEKKEISEDFQKAQLALVQEKNNSQALQDELFLVQKSLQNAESYKLVIESLESEKQELIKILFDKKKGQTELQALLEEIRGQLAEKTEQIEAKEEQHIAQTNLLKANIKQYEEKVGSLMNEVTELKLRVSELTTEESALGQLVCLNKDVEQQLEATNKKLAEVTSEKEKLSEQLLGLCQNQEAASTKLLQSEKANFEIRECLSERDECIAGLKKLVMELRESQARYIPHKDDPIDVALAKYLNKSDADRVRFLFFRESCGVYQFGTKRVYIKLEGDKIIIRVGGGYSTIEEFLEQHLQFELEKFLKNGCINVSSKNVLANRNPNSRSSHSVERSKVQGY